MLVQQGRSVSLIPAQPAVLVVGDRRIPVDEWPLARSVKEKRTLEMVRSVDVLAIEPKRGTGIGWTAMFIVMYLSGAAIPGFVAAVYDAPWWLGVTMSLVLTLVLAFCLRVILTGLRWITFDRRSGKLVFERRIGFRKKRRIEQTYPLDCIRAVQLLYNGRHSIAEQQGAGEQQITTSREFDGYELNLVLEGAATPRLNLVSISDWQWIRETGGQIGEFLSVPVIDKLYHGG
jgi:hypothetical protein